MKNHILYSTLAALSLAVSFTSCEFEQEDYFEQSAALRIESTNADIKAKLCAASVEGQNGWLIQYFVGGTDDMNFEGFNLYGRFYESGKVVLASDHRYLRNGRAGKFTEYASSYEMLKEEGSVLAFNTWNDILTVFVDPVDPSAAPNTLSDNGEGMRGDDRLVMVSYSDDKMLFRGERYGAWVYFSRLDRPAEQYAADVQELKNRIATPNVTEYMITNNETTNYIAGLDHGWFDFRDRLDDPLQSSSRSCVFTPNGFKLSGWMIIGNDTVREMTVDDTYTKLVSGNVTMIPLWIRGVNRKVNTANATTITSDGGSDSFVALYDKLAQDIKASFSAQSFTGITFGKSSEAGTNSRYGIVFNVVASKNKYLTGFTGTVTVDTENNTATITADPNDYSNNFANYSKKGIGASFTDIVNAMIGTYQLETNDPFNPTAVKWTKTTDPSFYFQTKF